MAYRSMRQRMFESAARDMASTFDEDKDNMQKRANTPNYMCVEIRQSCMPFSNCYLCGTRDDVQEVLYGNKHMQNVLLMCPKCRKWFGEALLSDKNHIAQSIDD